MGILCLDGKVLSPRRWQPRGGARACGPMVFLRFGLRFKLPVPKFKAGKRQQFFTHLGASLCGPLAGLGLKV